MTPQDHWRETAERYARALRKLYFDAGARPQVWGEAAKLVKEWVGDDPGRTLHDFIFADAVTEVVLWDEE